MNRRSRAKRTGRLAEWLKDAGKKLREEKRRETDQWIEAMIKARFEN